MADWSAADAILVAKMWLDGARIAVIVNAIPAHSRNAIIGKVHRMGLPQRRVGTARVQGNAPKICRPSPVTRRAPPRPIPPLPHIPRLVLVEKAHVMPQGSGKTILDLGSRDCRYIIGEIDGLDTLYCADPAREGLPYCAVHHALCYTPASNARVGGLARQPGRTTYSENNRILQAAE